MNLAATFRALIAPAAGAAGALLLFATAASGATNQPLPPTGLSVAGATASSLSVVWTASADTSVVGYAYFLNGTRMGAVPTLHRTLTNLSCGQTYAVGVDAYNAAQVHSPLVVVNAPTAPCQSSSSGSGGSPPDPSPPSSGGGPPPKGPVPPPTTPTPPTPPILTGGGAAGLYVSPGGSNANACTSAKPCAGFDRAYHAASPGQIVWVLGGTYPAQTLTRDATKVSASGNVTFQTPAGQLAVVSGITLNDVHHAAFVGASSGDLSAAASGITLKPSPSQMNTGWDFTLATCSSAILVKNIDMRQFAINGSDNVTIDGGTVGGYDNSGGDSSIGGPYQGRGTSTCTAENPSSILITHVLFHDVQRTNMPSAHPDCLQFFGTASTVVDSNTFVRCGTSNVMARPNPGLWVGDTIGVLTFSNNSFSPATQGGAEAVVGAHQDVCGAVTFTGNNGGAGGISSFDCASYASLVVTNNTFGWFTSYGCQQLLTNHPNVVLSGNQFVGGAFACGTGAISGPPATGGSAGSASGSAGSSTAVTPLAPTPPPTHAG